MTTLIYPTNAELTEIAQNLIPRLAANRPIFQKFPLKDVDAHLIMWEQEDNYVGLQQIRGMNGAPPRVSQVGLKRYQMEPGIYGEFMTIDEFEITARRAFGTFATAVDITDLVMRRQRQLLQRRLDRIEYILWTLVTAGTFSVSGPGGAVLQTDSYSFQTYNGSAWATVATATPLADLRAVQLKGRGYSVDFGPSAEVWMNRVTYNNMIANENANDLYGRRISGFGTINNLTDLNNLLTRDGLPSVVVYDQGYLNDSGTFVPYLSDTAPIVFGKRTDGAPIGAYAMTRNANNPGLAPGAYMRVIDRGEEQVPRLIEVHDGHNGGPEISFPSAVVTMDVS